MVGAPATEDSRKRSKFRTGSIKSANMASSPPLGAVCDFIEVISRPGLPTAFRISSDTPFFSEHEVSRNWRNRMVHIGTHFREYRLADGGKVNREMLLWSTFRLIAILTPGQNPIER